MRSRPPARATRWRPAVSGASSMRSVQRSEVRLDKRPVLGGVTIGLGLDQIEPQPVGFAQQLGRDLRSRPMGDILARARLTLRIEVATIDGALSIEQTREDSLLLLLELAAGVAIPQ